MLSTVGDRLRNYTCADPTMVTTEKSIRDFTWEGRKVIHTTYIHTTCLSISVGNSVRSADVILHNPSITVRMLYSLMCSMAMSSCKRIAFALSMRCW
jgi:hypothetical protein